MAFGCDSLGKQLSTFIVLCCQHRCWRVVGIDFVQRSPEPHGTVSDGQFGGIHSPAFEAEQNLAPALSGLAHPVLDCQEPLLATGRDPNNHKGAELVILAAKAAVDAVSPDVDDWLVIERSVFPAVVFLGPIALEPRDRIR